MSKVLALVNCPLANPIIGRFWLEKLNRGLTYVSAVDQDSSAVIGAISTLHSGKTYLAVAMGLEELLFFKINKEWEDRSGLSSLLGQYELSLILGSLRLRISIP